MFSIDAFAEAREATYGALHESTSVMQQYFNRRNILIDLSLPTAREIGESWEQWLWPGEPFCASFELAHRFAIGEEDHLIYRSGSGRTEIHMYAGQTAFIYAVKQSDEGQADYLPLEEQIKRIRTEVIEATVIAEDYANPNPHEGDEPWTDTFAAAIAAATVVAESRYLHKAVRGNAGRYIVATIPMPRKE